MVIAHGASKNPVCWPEPLETVYQSLAGGVGSSLTPQLPHLTYADALFLGGLAGTPRASRPHGIITWASEVFRVSRTSIYNLGSRLEAKLLGGQAATPEPHDGELPNGDAPSKAAALIEVTPERLQRTILRATFPGNVSIRPTQQVVYEALDTRPSIGYISELRLEAGLKAGEVRRTLDYGNIGRVIVGRDETFFHGTPILTVIEPVSMTILLAEVCADRQADTWGAALLIAQEQGATIKGLVEDMASPYEKSQKLADLSEVAVQKDTWHLTRDSAKLLNRLEKTAYRAMQRVLDLEAKLCKQWDAKAFDTYVAASAAEAKAIEQYDTYAPLHSHLCDALAMVDWRSGEIRDPQTAAWFLDAILDEMAHCTDARILAFLKTLRNHRAHLLTFLDWLHKDLPAWQARLHQQLQDPKAADAFQRLVAQHWCLQQKGINGHRHWQALADDIALDLQCWTDDHESLNALASDLMRIFDEAGHTNSITECVNGLLKSFFDARQHFHSTETMQAYLDLFTLWHNTRIFERGKRQGQSPFQMAGVQTASDDWIALLGY